MKFILKTIILIFLFVISLLAFFPKIEAFNLLEKNLEKQNIIISDETKKESLFGLKLKGSEIYFDGINAAIIKDIDISTFLLYTNIKIDTIRVSKEFRNIVPSKIDVLNIKHSILTFDKIDIFSKGEFGELKGSFSLLEQKLNVQLTPSDIMKSKYRNILREFKLVDGKYKYEFKL